MSYVEIDSSPVDAASAHHHGSHKALLESIGHAPQDAAIVDAIVVPTARPSVYLQKAINLAAYLGCKLVALCSKMASTHHSERRAWAAGIEFVAIDTGRLPVGLVPAFATTKLLASTRFERRSDLSLKRNLGLLLARLAGWERIVFLDDDITVPRPDDLCDAVSLLGAYEGVGLRIGGFPDNSVVCHAYRHVGGVQDTFVGGGALAVGTPSMTSFFPNIYNEDWFFLLNNARLRPTTLTGRVDQEPYDPFANQARARAEEFGDTLAEGVYSLLDHGKRVQDANLAFWRGFLQERRQFIIEILTSIDQGVAERDRIIAALQAALGRNQRINPQMCVDYLRAWRIDRSRWRDHVETLFRQSRRRSQMPLTKVLSSLGLVGCSVYTTTTERDVTRYAARVARCRRCEP